MSLHAVTVPARESIGKYIPRERGPAVKRQIVLRQDWRMTVSECGERRYFARINESLVLNVHKRPGTRTWEYLVVGFDLTQPGTPTIGATGTAGTMKEAKYRAEEQIPGKTPGTNMTIWEESEDLPF